MIGLASKPLDDDNEEEEAEGKRRGFGLDAMKLVQPTRMHTPCL